MDEKSIGVIFAFLVVIVGTLLFLTLKSAGRTPAPILAPGPSPVSRTPGPSPVPAVPGPSPVVTQAPVVLGGYTFTAMAPAPTYAPAQAQAQAIVPPPATPPPQVSPLENLLNSFFNMLTSPPSHQMQSFLLADLMLNGRKSAVVSLANLFGKKVYKLGTSTAKFGKMIGRSIGKLASAEGRAAFSLLSIIERGRLGMFYGKSAARAGEVAETDLVQSAGTRGIGGDVVRSALSASRSAALGAANLAKGLVTDPLMVAAAVGMALDHKNVGNYAKLDKTEDLLTSRNSSLNQVYNLTQACTSYPLGAACPAPATTSSPSPAPPPHAGLWPKFVGPLDLMDPDSIYADMDSTIYSLLSDPGDPRGGFKETLDMMPSGTAKTSLSSLFDSINADTGSADPVQAPFIWASQQSQTIMQNAITALQGSSDIQSIVAKCRLKILLGLQKATSDYIVWLVNNNVMQNNTDISSADLMALLFNATNMPDSDFEEFFSSHQDFLCVNNGGVVFNPGNGWDSHTCTWATKEDCHGAFPWALPDGTIQDAATPRTSKLMCTTTCPAPCPAGAPSPSCPPPIPCPAPSPCEALTDPSKSDLLYTEWRSADWFSKSNWINTGGTPWNSQLDQNAMNGLQGACIVGDVGFHSLCDEKQIVGLCSGSNPSSNNIYIRDQGTCVNSKQLCDIKGVTYTSSMAASQLGSGDVEGASYPSCYITGTQQFAEDLAGSTLIRAAQSGTQVCVPFDPISHINTGISAVDVPVNGVIDALNTVGSGLAEFAGDTATFALQVAASGIHAADATQQVLQSLTPDAIQQVNNTFQQSLADYLSGSNDYMCRNDPNGPKYIDAGNGSHVCCPINATGQENGICSFSCPPLHINNNGSCDACPPNNFVYNNKCIDNATKVGCPTCPPRKKVTTAPDTCDCVCDDTQGYFEYDMTHYPQEYTALTGDTGKVQSGTPAGSCLKKSECKPCSDVLSDLPGLQLSSDLNACNCVCSPGTAFQGDVLQGGVSMAACFSTSSSCPPGQYVKLDANAPSGYTCTPCGINHYKSGTNSRLACDFCPAGTSFTLDYMNGGAPDISACKAPCPSGQVYDSASKTCKPCTGNTTSPGNTLDSNSKITNACTPCPPGTVTDQYHVNCTPLPQNTYWSDKYNSTFYCESGKVWDDPSGSCIPANADCVGSWAACSKSCDGGTQDFIVAVPARGTGTCPAPRACNTQACPQPLASGVPKVIGLKYQFGSVGWGSTTQGNLGDSDLSFQSSGSVNVNVRVRGTTLALNVTNCNYTKGDVRVYIDASVAPWSGTIVLEDTNGTELARQTVTDAWNVVFPGVATGGTPNCSGGGGDGCSIM
jgi:hypothetical protein